MEVAADDLFVNSLDGGSGIGEKVSIEDSGLEGGGYR